MQVGSLLTSTVMTYTSRVLVNGVQRPHVSWSVDRELAGDMPDQVVAGSGITQATGSVVWAASEDVTDAVANPWNAQKGWLPRIGDRVQIFAGDTITEWVQFTGRIDRTTGNLESGASSSLIDDYDKLSTTLSHEPLLRIMPPTVDGGSYRGIGLNSSYFADAAMRAAGFYVTPKTEENASLSVPAQGSMWAEVGKMTRGGAKTGSGSHHSLDPAPWGWSVGNFDNAYSPALVRAASAPTQISFLVASDHVGIFSVTCRYGDSHSFRLAVDASRVVSVSSSAGGSLGYRGGLSLGSASVVTLLVKGNAWQVRTSAGGSTSGTFPQTVVGTLEFINTDGTSGTRVAGIQVSHPETAGQEFASVNYKRSATMDFTDVALNSGMDASRALENVRSDELLKDISSATLTGIWIDEFGVLQWIPTRALRKRPSSRTVTTLKDIFSLEWESSLLGARSKVTIEALQPSITNFSSCAKTLWRGSGIELSSEETSEEFVSPPADEDWISPDGTLEVIGDGSWARYNIRSGSISGVFYTASGETTSSAGLNTSIAMGKVGLRTYKIRHVAGVLPPDVTAVVGTSPTAASLWPRNRDKDLPVIRGFGKVVWVDARVTPITVGGPGPELVHDAGVWNNQADSTEIIERFGTYLSGQTANPKPVITGLQVVYDPRTQLGDVITIDSPALMGAKLVALVVGVSNSSSGEYTQSLSVRLITANIAATTWAEFEAENSGNNYSQLETLWGAQDYAALEADPLKVV